MVFLKKLRIISIYKSFKTDVSLADIEGVAKSEMVLMVFWFSTEKIKGYQMLQHNHWMIKSNV